MRKNRKIAKRLRGRVKDYNDMIAKPKIGDGHRDESGYHRPGSNKK